MKVPLIPEPHWNQREMAKAIGVKPPLLIYWEEYGLIKPVTSKGNKNKLRSYNLEDFLKLKLIRKLYQLGLSTKMVKRLMEDEEVVKEGIK